MNKIGCETISRITYEILWIFYLQELEALIKVNKLTHKLLSENLALDEFHSMFQEANHNVLAPYGKQQFHNDLKFIFSKKARKWTKSSPLI